MTRASEGEPDDPISRRQRPWTAILLGRLRPRGWLARFRAGDGAPRGRRLLFLDDDPGRAELFLKDHPQAVWVTNVPDCLDRLAEPWDEVHLDHDLGGKVFVDSAETDCGMEVIRWLRKAPRPHLKSTRFFVHTHNAAAGLLMVLLMQGGGYKAEFRPFGLDLQELLAHNETGPEAEADRNPATGRSGVLRWLVSVVAARLAALAKGAVRPLEPRAGAGRSTAADEAAAGIPMADGSPTVDQAEVNHPSDASQADAGPIETQQTLSESARVIQPPPRIMSP